MKPSAGLQSRLRRLRAAVHVAARKRELIVDTASGPDETAYRNLLGRFGVTSSRDLNVPQLLTLLDLINGKPTMLASSDRDRPANVEDSPQLRKIDTQLHALRKTWAYAIGIAKQMYGRERIEWCTGPELGGIITALSQHQRRQAQR